MLLFHLTSAPTSYAKLVTGEIIKKSVNFRTLITPARNGAEVVVPLESILTISEQFAKMAYGFFLGKRVAYPVVANYVRNTWGKYGLVKSMLNSFIELFYFQFSSMDGLDSMLENGLWFILKNEDGLSTIATKHDTPLMLDSYTSDMYMQSWGRSSYARAIQLQADVELKDTIVALCLNLLGRGSIRVQFVLSMSENLLAPRGVSVGPKVGFKPVKQVYRPVSKKNNVNTSVNKKTYAESRKEVSNPKPFDVFNSVENDVDLGTNGGTSNLASKEVNSGGMWDLVDKPLKNVVYSGDHNSEDQVEPVDNEMTSFLALKRVGYCTNSVLEQWKETYENADYDYDPYDDDMHERKEIPGNIQSICDNLHIKVRGRKKK
ncbi:hypothetical protein Tco_1206007 [Tanacetum coccineum]